MKKQTTSLFYYLYIPLKNKLELKPISTCGDNER